MPTSTESCRKLTPLKHRTKPPLLFILHFPCLNYTPNSVLLCKRHDRLLIKSLKLKCYAHHNKASKFLANRIKSQKAKAQIQYPLHHPNKSRLLNPQAIADAFADYYNSLYNLKDDSSTHQPSDAYIYKPS